MIMGNKVHAKTKPILNPERTHIMTRTQTLLATVFAASFATMGFAAGSDSTEPPVQTETTLKCKDGKIWDEKKAKCVDAQSGALTDDEIYNAARELAYNGQYENALNVLAAAENQNDPRILNYKGFAMRKAGRLEDGMIFYQAALQIDPDYILARSYMGQALITQGDFTGAEEQLVQIANRGGKDTWAYAALEKALRGEATDW
jgi:tetratricopeptide (TPR) repeat protein